MCGCQRYIGVVEMDIARLEFDETALVAIQVLRLQVELNDGYTAGATRSVEELVMLLEWSLNSESDDVRKALIQFIGRINARHVICFETLGVNFQTIKQWATERHIVLSNQPD